MATLMGTLVLVGSLSIQGTQQICEMKTSQTEEQPYTKYAVTEQLHDSLNGMSDVHKDSISNMAADTISSDNVGSNYGYIGYAFTTLGNMIRAGLGIYC